MRCSIKATALLQAATSLAASDSLLLLISTTSPPPPAKSFAAAAISAGSSVADAEYTSERTLSQGGEHTHCEVTTHQSAFLHRSGGDGAVRQWDNAHFDAHLVQENGDALIQTEEANDYMTVDYDAHAHFVQESNRP
jgi:hypothetical protein